MPETATRHARTNRQSVLERFDNSEQSDYAAKLAGVELEPAPDAAACGAAGCRDTVQLIRGEIEKFGQRVLCADHMADLIQKEVLNDE